MKNIVVMSVLLGLTICASIRSRADQIGDMHLRVDPTAPHGQDLNSDPARPAALVRHSILLQTTEGRALVSGTIDATPVINAALSKGGVFLPCGTYRLDSALIPLSQAAPFLRGAGRSCVELHVRFVGGNAIQLGQMGMPGLGVRSVSVGGFTLVADVTRESGTGIAVGTHYDAEIDDFAFEGPWTDQVHIQGNGGSSSRTFIRNFRLGTTSGTTRGVCLRITDYANATWIENGGMNRCGQGIIINSATATVLGTLDVFGSTGPGVSVAPSAAHGDNVNALYTSGPVWSDTSGTNGWEFIGDGKISDVHLEAAWGSGSGSAISETGATSVTKAAFGLLVGNAGLDGLTIGSGSHFHNNGASGIAITNGRNIVVAAGVQVWNNGAVDATGAGASVTCGVPRYDGITLLSPATNLTVMGVQTGRGGYFGGTLARPSCQRYGLFAGSGSNDPRTLTIMGVQAPGNMVGGLSIPTGAGIISLGNSP